MSVDMDLSHVVTPKIVKRKRLTWDERKRATEKRRRSQKRRYAKSYYKRKVRETEKAIREDPIKVFESRWPQYMSFSHDCLVPSLIYWTRFNLIYNQYKRYCAVIGEEPELSKLGFVKLLAQQFVRREHAGGSLYSVVLRKDVIIEDTDALPDIYASEEHRELMINPPKEELVGENWAEGEEYDE